MVLKNLSTREKVILSFCVLLALTYIVFNFIIEPVKERITYLNNEISTKELKLKKSYKIINRKDASEQAYKKYGDYIRQNYSDEQEMSALLSEIESIARNINIQISDMKPLRVKVVDFYKKFSIEVEAEGQLEKLTQFIHILQNQPHFLKIERLRLERRSMRTNLLKSYILITRVRTP